MRNQSDSSLVVATQGLEKTFCDFWRRPRVRAVRGVSLEIGRGEIFGLLGPNGAGKTTILKMLMGLLEPTGGTISVLGHDPRNVAAKKHIGYLPEESRLYDYLTASETLDFYGRLFDITGQERSRRVRELLCMVGLDKVSGRPVGQFSKGMARRLGLAQALINKPGLLVLDEPTSGLDPLGCRRMKDIMLSLAANGTAIMLSSHLLADVEDVCDRVAILYDGRVLAAGNLPELLEKKDHISIQMPVMPGEKLAGLLDRLRSDTGSDPRVSHPAIGLEDYFVDIVGKASGQEAVPDQYRNTPAIAPFLTGGSE